MQKLQKKQNKVPIPTPKLPYVQLLIHLVLICDVSTADQLYAVTLRTQKSKTLSLPLRKSLLGETPDESTAVEAQMRKASCNGMCLRVT